MMHSLRIRLIWLLGGAILLTTALQFFTTLRASINSADVLFDYHMEQMAVALQDNAIGLPNLQTFRSSPANDFDFVIQIWADGVMHVYRSRDYRALPPAGQPGYSDVTLPNGEWRLYVVRSNNRLIQIAQKLDSRRNRAISLALRSVWPIIPAALLLLGAVWWVVTASLRPMNRIVRDLAQRNAGSLAPVAGEGIPQEVSPLVSELNSLLARVEGALQSQHRFVADAAHELRTPLAALRLQVQTLARSRDDGARSQAVSRLLGGVDRATRLVEQLLALARHDPLSEQPTFSHIFLADCIEKSIADVAALASQRHIELECKICPHAMVYGDDEGLCVLIRNLVDNAVRYTPDGGTVKIALTKENQAAVLTVQDSGPGIPPENRTRVFDRFYRVPGTGANGTGLGLAIVKAIADRHGISISLDASTLGGLEATVKFPLSAV